MYLNFEHEDLKMDAAISYEIFLRIYEPPQRHTPEGLSAEGLQIKSRKPAVEFLVCFNEMQRIRHVSLIHCSAIVIGAKNLRRNAYNCLPKYTSSHPAKS
jgi:hypothetical protein